MLAPLGPGRSSPTAAAALAEISAAAEAVDRYCRLEIALDPATGRLDGLAILDFPDLGRFLTTEGELPLRLDARLEIAGVTIAGEAAAVERVENDGDDYPRRIAHWTLRLAPGAASAGSASASSSPAAPVAVRFGGVLRENVGAGEAPGRIHNTAMRAHVGEDGIYLAPEAAWHPVIDASRSPGWTSPDPPLCRFTLEATSPLPLVAGGEREPPGAAAEPGDRGPRDAPAAPSLPSQRWVTPFPQAAMAVAGAPWIAFERDHEDMTIRALLRSGSERHAEGLLDAVASYLDLYEPLLGPYPFREFAVAENFFSSGFAFPGFTLLSSQVIRMGERGLRPGYLDHELLHGWWGHGVLASRSSGHWSEALASYCANYKRPVLEGRREQGRAQRRSVAETLSGSPELAGQAVGDFGRDHGVSSYVGYQKGAMVLDQLAARIGQETLWAGLRRFHRDRLGKLSSWEDLEAAFEAESGRDLGSFFDFWIDGPGLPSPRLGHAVWDGERGRVRLDVSYADPVPIELGLKPRFADPALDRDSRVNRVTLTPGDETVELATAARPVALEVDPEYATLRRLPPELLMPTLAGLAPPIDLALVAREDDLGGYAAAAAAVEERYGEHGVHRTERFTRELLAEGHVLALGQAALEPELLELFGPEGVELWPRGFAVAAVRHVSTGDAILACVRNPRRAGAFVCLYWGNGEEALEQAHLLPFYGGNSLLVFDRGRPFQRRDFEAVERIEVR